MARRHFRGLADIGLVERGVGDFDRQPTALRHGVAGVEGQIENGALDLGGIGQGVPQAAADYGFDFDRFAEGAAQEFGHVADEAGEIDDLRVQGLTAGKGEELARQLGGAVGAVDRVSDRALSAIVARRGALQELEVAADHLQQVVEIVGDTAGQLAHRFHALRLREPLLGPHPVGDVPRGPDDAVDDAGLVAHRRQDRPPRPADLREVRRTLSRVSTGRSAAITCR